MGICIVASQTAMRVAAMNAAKANQKAAEERKKREQGQEEGRKVISMAKYFVGVVMATCVEIEVEADSEEEARELAIEKADPFDVYDIDSIEREDDEEEEEE